MLLILDNPQRPMKKVYSLSEELKEDPEYAALTRSVTLDESKPNIGLNGTFGLFDTKEWWDNIKQRKMPLLFLNGVIKRSYVAGQDSSKFNNTIDLLLDDGSIKMTSIYVNNESDADLFKVGHAVSIVYALDELKPAAASLFGQKYNQIALEMAISLEPVT